MTEKNPYSELDEKGVKEQLALFKEALKGKETVDLYTEFALEKPKEITDEEKAKFATLEENTDKLSEITKLLGVSKSTTSDITEPTPEHKKLLVRQEKLEQSAFSDKISEIKSINSEFNSEGIEKLDIPTSEKIAVAGTVKEIVTKYQEGYDKLKSELTSTDASTKDTKLSGTAQDKSTDTNTDETPAGKSIVAKFASQHNLELKKDTKKDTDK